MIKKILLILCLLLIVSPVFAHEISLSWNLQTDATGYKVRHSIDNGLTWGEETDVGTSNNTIYTFPDNGLVLFQIGAYNTIDTTWRLDTGIFYNADWKIPEIPTNIGVQ